MRCAPRPLSLRTSAWRAVVAIALAAVAACGGKEPSRGARTVVLITVDTLRQDHVSAYARAGAVPPARTPRMDALAVAGLRFTDARTPVPLTLPAHVTMLSGRPPAAHGVRSNSASRVAPPEQRGWRLVAETLAARGRCCGAFVSADPLVVRYGLASGFETYDDGGLGSQTGGGYSERKGTDTVARAVEWLRKLPRSAEAFLWVHLFEPHAPHAKSYAADVEQADAAVGLLLDGLGDVGRGDAAIVLAADHGEALGELGEASHGFLLGESVLRVPLLVKGPGLAPGLRTDPADLSDVAPILLHLAGVTPPPGRPEGAFGRDLLEAPAPSDRARVAEGLHGWHQHRWAQLTLALVGDQKVEDRGPGGVLLLQLNHEAPPWQDAGTPVEGHPESVAAVDALRAYRRLEDRTPRPGGAAPEGYGAGGAVGFFLEPEENARHPDGYSHIEDVRRIQEAAAWILAEPPGTERIEEALRRLARVGLGDPDNPAVPFWRGRGLRILARHREAVAAFSRALELGRADAETLLLAMRSATADGAPREALALETRYGAALGSDARILEAEGDAWMALGEPSKAAEARLRAVRPGAKPSAPPLQGCR